MNEEALTQELMATYRAEARERLEAITRVLLEIERDPSGSERAQQVEHVFREVHSLKGAARSVSESAVERVAHAFENAIVAANKRPTVEDLPLHDWYGHLDQLGALIDSRVAAVPAEESIRVATPRLDPLVADVGALLVGEQARAQLVRDLAGLAEGLTSAEQRWHRSQAGRQSGGWAADLHPVRPQLKLSIQSARQQQAEMRRQLDTLDNDIRELRMMTVGGLFRSFERMVKDLTPETGKRV